jgi:hypothetical protein
MKLLSVMIGGEGRMAYGSTAEKMMGCPQDL